MTQLWCNGQWLETIDFAPSPTDRGLTLGFGLFETILAIDGIPIFADLHLARLHEGCARLGWNPKFPEIDEIMIDLIMRNGYGIGRARIRLAISGGSGKVQDLGLGADHVIWMTVSPVGEPPYSTTATFSPWPRNEHSPMAGLKCSSYAENLIALQHAHRQGFEEAVFLNTAGHICEAATSNLFMVHGGRISTPPLGSGCLPGITRSLVIELANQQGIPCEERLLTRDDLHAADEVFLTSSIRGIMGLAKFESRDFPHGLVTQLLREGLKAVIARKTQGARDVFH